MIFKPKINKRVAASAPEVTVINDDGNKETIKIHGGFKFDGYLELTRVLKDYLGLDDKWIGIAFEAQGIYWHNLPNQKEADRKKRLISKEKNILLIEIWEDKDKSTWMNDIISQVEKKTGVRLTERHFTSLRKYLGSLK